MSKKPKLNLNELKVQSFITTINDKKKTKVKGGSDWHTGFCCETVLIFCPPTMFYCPPEPTENCPGPTEVYENTCGNGCSVNWC